jgi:hypothetical protein
MEVDIMRGAIIGIGLSWITLVCLLVLITSLIYFLRDNVRHL